MAFKSLFVSVVLLTVASTREPPTEKTRETEESFGQHGSIPREIFTASWAVEITEGVQKMADKIARQYGFNNLGEVYSFIDNNYSLNAQYLFAVGWIGKHLPLPVECQGEIKSSKVLSLYYKGNHLSSERCVSANILFRNEKSSGISLLRLDMLSNRLSDQQLLTLTECLKILSSHYSGNSGP